MIRKRLGLPVKVYYDTLIYRQTTKEFLTLHVYLVPPDHDVQQTVERKETSYGSIIIPKPNPDKSLEMQDHFLLTANMNTAEINPDKLKLQYDRRNFFEVFIRNAESDFSLTLTSKQKKNGREDTVWTCTIRKGDYMNESTHEEDQHFVDRYRPALVQRVRKTGELLDKLLVKKWISQEQYDTVRALKTSQEQMREIFQVVTSAGKRGKDTLYEILEKAERNLIEDLKRST
ncbi:NACHT, LRR and PYD domains-containing protein 1-like [Cheilinus undulatus]|uniref:NACHT, LRR and PYD domains-containing protein 1-like n=1 Tax=Cheilinus undulatus TaxID=241271 RepID=UPI001BD669B9|nr:NACHT, LRR and PYD domains-containing protein 1-like [Cheilinus undulatus]